MTDLQVNDCVVARRTITESGLFATKRGHSFPHPLYIHALKGHIGKVIGIDDGQPTVRFNKTGTATVVSLKEVRLLPWR